MTERLPLAVVLVRQREAWRKGAPLPVEQLLEDQPHLADDDDAVLDLIYSERLLREELGQAAPLDEYMGRFPHLEAALRVMFEVDDSLTPDGLASTPRDPVYNLSTVETAAGQPSVPSPVPRLEGLELLG